jgi:hypothetical protein
MWIKKRTANSSLAGEFDPGCGHSIAIFKDDEKYESQWLGTEILQAVFKNQ